MKPEQIAKYVKALTAVLTVAGVIITPEHQEALTGGFLAIYAIISALQGKFFKGEK